VRDLALQVLFQVQVKRAFAERVIDDLAEQFRLDQRDRGFLNELVKGTCAAAARSTGTSIACFTSARQPAVVDPERAPARCPHSCCGSIASRRAPRSTRP
jgi:hypothetical protein